MSGFQTAVMNLVREEINVGGALLDAVGAPMRRMRMTRGRCCEIPPPCWMPQPLDDCVSHTAECRSASLSLLVTNRSLQNRAVQITVSGTGANLVQVTPTSASIPPFDRAAFELIVNVPQNTANGVLVDVLVMVHGCRTFYFRWIVSVGTIGRSCCGEIEIDDGPDLVHHWYDHFYCPRPCPPSVKQ